MFRAKKGHTGNEILVREKCSQNFVFRMLNLGGSQGYMLLAKKGYNSMAKKGTAQHE